MKTQLFVMLIALALVAGCLLAYNYLGQPTRHLGTDAGPIPLSQLNGSEISLTPLNITLRFESVVVSRGWDGCIELFTPDEFKKYDGDPKWAISSTLGFEPGLFNRLPKSGKAIVTGRYISARGVNGGACGILTGQLFEISEIQYC